MTFLPTEPVVLVKKETLTSEHKMNSLRTKKLFPKMCIKFLEESQRIHAYYAADK